MATVLHFMQHLPFLVAIIITLTKASRRLALDDVGSTVLRQNGISLLTTGFKSSSVRADIKNETVGVLELAREPGNHSLVHGMVGKYSSKDGILVSSEQRSNTKDGTIVKEMVAVASRGGANKTGGTSSEVELSTSTNSKSKEAVNLHVDHPLGNKTKSFDLPANKVNMAHEAQRPFIKITKISDDNGISITTKITVNIMTPRQISFVYLALFFPFGMMWVCYFALSRPQGLWTILLPLTLLVIIVGMDLAGQSLVAIFGDPNAVTAMQSWALALITGLWMIWNKFGGVQVCDDVDTHALWIWILAAAAFAITQVVNHLAYWRCSLYERTVFLNLAPVGTVIIEHWALPPPYKPNVPLGQKMGLSVTVLGALILGFQHRSSSAASIVTASLLVMAMVLCRLLQRILLARFPTLPVVLLACIDGLLLALVSTPLAASSLTAETRSNIYEWSVEPSVSLLLAMSMLTFTAFHIIILVILRQTSATNALVFANTANIINLVLGVRFLVDSAAHTSGMTPTRLVGIACCLFSGLWYVFASSSSSSSSNWQPLECSPKGGKKSGRTQSIHDDF
jgi:hypothetical protein